MTSKLNVGIIIREFDSLQNLATKHFPDASGRRKIWKLTARISGTPVAEGVIIFFFIITHTEKFNLLVKFQYIYV